MLLLRTFIKSALEVFAQRLESSTMSRPGPNEHLIQAIPVRSLWLVGLCLRCSTFLVTVAWKGRSDDRRRGLQRLQSCRPYHITIIGVVDFGNDKWGTIPGPSTLFSALLNPKINTLSLALRLNRI